MPIALALQRLRCHTNTERLGNSPVARWFTALVNQLDLGPATSGAKPGPLETLYTKTTPLFSPSGQMTLANNWTKAAEHCRQEPTHLLAALTAWRCVDKYAGANLDHASTGDAHMSSHGKAAQQGVPGATWLALHAFAAFRLTGTARRGDATGWEHTPTGPAFTWPTWHPPLTPTAITTLLEHPLQPGSGRPVQPLRRRISAAKGCGTTPATGDGAFWFQDRRISATSGRGTTTAPGCGTPWPAAGSISAAKVAAPQQLAHPHPLAAGQPALPRPKAAAPQQPPQ
ncbi:Syd protein [Streptomyces sp. NBRC 110611]|nr:Syd protein [Streptomyces sp. NBRC 110611]